MDSSTGFQGVHTHLDCEVKTQIKEVITRRIKARAEISLYGPATYQVYLHLNYIMLFSFSAQSQLFVSYFFTLTCFVTHNI